MAQRAGWGNSRTAGRGLEPQSPFPLPSLRSRLPSPHPPHWYPNSFSKSPTPFLSPHPPQQAPLPPLSSHPLPTEPHLLSPAPSVPMSP